MPLQCYTGSLVSGAGTGTVTVTGIPFTPKAVILFSTVPTAMDAWQNCSDVTVGFADDTLTGAACYGHHFDDNDASADASRAKRLGECLALFGTSSYTLVAALSAITSDGFTVNFTTNSFGARYYNYIAIGGSGVQVIAGEANVSPAAPGNKSVTGVGFKPDIVFFGGAPFASAGDQAAGAQPLTGPMFGWYAGAAGERVVVGNALNNLANTSVFRYQSDTNCIARCADTSGNPMLALASGVSLDNDGFTLNWSATPGNNFTIPFLAIKGCVPVVGTITQPTSTGNQSISVGVSPKVAIFISSHQTVVDTQAEDFMAVSIGAEDGTREQGMVWAANDNVSPSENAELISTSKAISLLVTNGVNATGGSTTAAADASVSFGSTSLEVNWTTADATQRLIPYVVLAAMGGGGGAGKGPGGGKKGGGGGLNVIQPGGTLLWNIGNPGLDIGST